MRRGLLSDDSMLNSELGRRQLLGAFSHWGCHKWGFKMEIIMRVLMGSYVDYW